PRDDGRDRAAAAGQAPRRPARGARRDRHADRLQRHAGHADGGELQRRPGAAARAPRSARRDPRAVADRAGAAGRQPDPEARPRVPLTLVGSLALTLAGKTLVLRRGWW